MTKNTQDQEHRTMGENKPQDGKAMPPASAGSVGGDPRKYPASTPQVSLVPAEMYHALVVAHEEIARLRLTDEERKAISRIYDLLSERSRELHAARRLEEARPYVQLANTLQTMWERLK